MSLGMLGNKVGMTQIFTEDGNANPVTIIKVGPCVVTQIKTTSTDEQNPQGGNQRNTRNPMENSPNRNRVILISSFENSEK